MGQNNQKDQKGPKMTAAVMFVQNNQNNQKIWSSQISYTILKVRFFWDTLYNPLYGKQECHASTDSYVRQRQSQGPRTRQQTWQSPIGCMKFAHCFWWRASGCLDEKLSIIAFPNGPPLCQRPICSM